MVTVSKDLEKVHFFTKDAEYIENLFTKSYDLERDRKDKILGNLGPMVAAFGGILAGVNIAFTRLPNFKDALFWIFLGFCIIVLVILLRTFWLPYKLVSGSAYKLVRTPMDTLKDAKDLCLYYKTGHERYVDEKIKHDLRLNFIVELADAASHNYLVNNKRLKMRLAIYKNLALCAALTSVLFFLETVCLYSQNPEGNNHVQQTSVTASSGPISGVKPTETTTSSASLACREWYEDSRN